MKERPLNVNYWYKGEWIRKLKNADFTNSKRNNYENSKYN